MVRSSPGAALVLAGLLVLACKPAEQPAADPAPPAAAAVAPAVEILSPAAGDTVSLPAVVRLSATGVEVVPASGLVEEGKGHHHLIIDVDVPDAANPLPSVAGVVHLGSGVQEYTLEGLAPGPHRLIAVFAAGNHVAMPSVRADTVSFVVR